MFLWIELLVFGFALIVDAKDSDPFLNIFGNSSRKGGAPTDWNQTNVDPNFEDPDWINQTDLNQNFEEDPDGIPQTELDSLFEEDPRPGKPQVPKAGPGKPEDISWNSSNSTIEITWKKPQSKENGPVDGYRVCLWENDHCSKTDNVSKNTKEYIWNDLKPYKNYNVRVWAYTKTLNNAILEGPPSSTTIPTKAAKPTPVRELQVDPLNQEISAVKIKCREPEQINGPKENYSLYLLDEETLIYANKTCYFEVTDLCHSTTYQFKVIFYNGEYFSDPVISNPVGTRYVVYIGNYGNLMTCFAFLITGKSLALLLLLRKIHNLIKKNSRDQDVPMQPLNRDYENYGRLSKTMDVAEQTEPLTGSQMCTPVRSPGRHIGHREENELNIGLD